MSMPWDSQPPKQPLPVQRPYVPPPQEQYQPPAQQMQPDIPLVARNPQTGETVRVDVGADLREAIRQAITQTVVEGRDQFQANAQKALAKAVTGEKIAVQAPVPAAVVGTDLEDNFQMGPATKRSLVQGLTIDMGFAAMATLMTVTSTDFNIADKEAWIFVGVMMLKTVLQTGMSYVMRLKVT